MTGHRSEYHTKRYNLIEKNIDHYKEDRNF